jgi:peroxiredoxin
MVESRTFVRRLLLAGSLLSSPLAWPAIGTAQESAAPVSGSSTSATTPAESKPAETQPAADQASGEAKPAETKPAETKATESQPAEAQPTEKKPGSAEKKEAEDQILAGHSYHGTAFNEGPRQAAYLMEGLGRVRFPVTSQEPLAQQFVSQGVAQLHGFWYFEAERSFRQAAAIDPQCATAYWGMALANLGNEKRAKEFMVEAVKHKSRVSRREQLYIEALDAYYKADANKKKERAEAYTRALEKMLYEFPDDIEAKSFLALQLWNNRSAGIPITSHLAIDALIGQVLEVEPLHPIHHYRIHLWDYERPENALTSAARCGQSLPAIAHMWHMPGHIYSRLKRYNDAIWQQEASARVDHAHMMRDQVLPDQIHNFAHNNEWLIRNLNFAGRVQDAVDLAINMIELPQHPRYNTINRRGSTYYGRQRLFETLSRYELWDQLIALCDTPYLPPTENKVEQVKRLRHLAIAFVRDERPGQAGPALTELRDRLAAEQKQRDEAQTKAEEKAQQAAIDRTAIEKAGKEAREKAIASGADEPTADQAKAMAEQQTRESQLAAKKDAIKKAKDEAGRPFTAVLGELEQALAEVTGFEALAAGDPRRAVGLLKKGQADPLLIAHAQLAAGQTEEAVRAGLDYVNGHGNEVQPRARLTELLWKAGKLDQARTSFDELRKISGPIDLRSPVFTRLQPLAAELGYPADWRVPYVVPNDVGDRPEIDTLGPFRWQPSPAPEWSLANAAGTPLTLKHFRGQPVVVIFYLGHGCLHCAEQLHAFAPEVPNYREAGIEVVAISTDSANELSLSIANYDPTKLPMPLLANPELDAFKAYRCYDDFEKQPLHGTFLIDGQGRIRWQDIGFEPFKDPQFLLRESKRLLGQDRAMTPDLAAVK